MLHPYSSIQYLPSGPFVSPTIFLSILDATFSASSRDIPFCSRNTHFSCSICQKKRCVFAGLCFFIKALLLINCQNFDNCLWTCKIQLLKETMRLRTWLDLYLQAWLEPSVRCGLGFSWKEPGYNRNNYGNNGYCCGDKEHLPRIFNLFFL